MIVNMVKKIERLTRPHGIGRYLSDRGVHRESGQATVEYTGLAVAVAVLLVAIGSGMGQHGDRLGTAVAKRVGDAIKAQSE